MVTRDPSSQLPTELEDRLTAWLDAEMDERELQAFESEFAQDPELEAEARSLETTVELLRRMPSAEAPNDFLTAVQSRIRRRSRGRYFGYDGKIRFPYEAAFSVVLIGLMFALYIVSMQPAVGPPVKAVSGASLEAPLAGSHLETLGAFGSVSAGETADLYRVVLPSEQLPGLKQAVAKDLSLELVGEPVAASGADRLIVTVRAGP